MDAKLIFKINRLLDKKSEREIKLFVHDDSWQEVQWELYNGR